MCGRFTLTDPARLPAAFPRFRFPEFSETRLPALGPRFNIAPAQEVLGVRNNGQNSAELLHWGIQGRINIRAESLAARRDPIRRRCIEFADGFYEWRDRRPVYYSLKTGKPFAFAGLWVPENGSAACDIVTCEPNALVEPIHNRMPVMLTPETLELWLDPEPLPPEVAGSILRPFDAALMQARDVSRRVNNANHDAPDVLQRDPDSPGLFDRLGR